MASLFPFPKFKAEVQGTKAPLSGGKLYVYTAGTTTPATSYTDRGAGTANANPVILDANGEANVWLPVGSFKLLLKDSADVTQWTVDDISGGSDQSFWVASGSDIYYAAGNVGVGTSTITETLTVDGTMSASDNVSLAADLDLTGGDLDVKGFTHLGYGTVSDGGVFNNLVIDAGTDPATGDKTAGVQIRSGSDTSSALIYFGSPTSIAGSKVAWRYNNLTMDVGTGIAGGKVTIQTNSSDDALTLDENQDAQFFGDAQVDGALAVTGNTVFTGDVGVGVSPARNLHVNASDTTAYFLLTNSTTGATATDGTYILQTGVDLDINNQEIGKMSLKTSGSERVTILADGKVGIGTSPISKLQVSSGSSGVTPNASGADFLIENNASGGATIAVPNGSNANLFFGTPNDVVGAKIVWAEATKNFTLGAGVASGGTVELISGNNVVAMHIDSSQNIGIGTSSPDTKVHLVETALNSSTLTPATAKTLGLYIAGSGLSGSSNDVITGIAMGEGQSGVYAYDAGSSGAQGFGIFTGSNSAVTEKLRITSSGNVGIGGVTSPSSLLQVTDGEGTVPTLSTGTVGVFQNNDTTTDNCSVSILAGATGNSNIFFGDASDQDAGKITYSHSSSTLNLVNETAGGNVTLNGTSVGMGTESPDASAKLDVTSTTQGFLPPRLTGAQRTAISSPTAGLVIYNTSNSELNVYTGAAWYALDMTVDP